jgi:tRNA nucleotidyltransferase (CCA-adding enzyme)
MDTILLQPWPTNPRLRREIVADALPPERLSLMQMVADEATRRGLPLYIVGGFVRDLLLGRHATDFDLVVEGDAVTLAHVLAKKYGGKVTAHSRFGTAQWFLPQSLVVSGESSASPDSRLATLDLISARSESYAHPGALPKVKLGSLTDDLRRRDFTINALAIRLDGDHFGELRDDLGGLDDLRRGLIRALHLRSFVDDPTRIFRAVRYEKRLGFQVADETLALLPEALPLIDKLSAERVRHELDLILEEENTAFILKRLAELKVLNAVHPALAWNQSIRKRFEKIQVASSAPRLTLGWMAWLAHLSAIDIEQIDGRLHFKANLRDEILAASALYADLDSLTGKKPSQCVAILNNVPLPAIAAVELFAPRGEARRNLHNYIEMWRYVKPKTTGHTLKKLGLEPGPVYQSILMKLKNAWLDGEITSPAQENERLRVLLEELSL